MSIRPWVAVILVFVFLLFLTLCLSVWIIWTLNRPASVSKNTIVEVSISGTFNEVPRDNPILEVFESKKLSLYDLWELFDLASKDKDVSAIYLEIHPLGLTFSQIEELRSSIHKFRSSGKKIHAFLSLDIAGENEIYLASAADTLLINPGAGLILNGLVAEIQFYKKLLVKVGIKPEFIQFKEFKSPEQYTRINMSQSIRSMMKSILEDMQVRFIKAVSNDRKIKESVFLFCLSPFCFLNPKK